MKLINIGSHDSNEYQVDDPTVSRKHAQLFWDGDKLIILTDLDSTNGTFVNGKKLKTPTPLNQLDVVKVGNTLIPWMELMFEGDSQEEIKIPVSNKNEEHNNEQLNGISGWLIIVAIGIILSPIYMFVGVFPLYTDLFNNGSWEIITTPGTTEYSPLWAPILISEIAVNIGLLLLWIYIAIIFFLKKSTFPKIYIGALLFSIAFIVIDAFAVKLVIPNEPVFDDDTTNALLNSIISAAIWIPYILMSKRVKATFKNA
jgi:pSer/pThr/pTyr-binding forkhead associated (FHA) protein